MDCKHEKLRCTNNRFFCLICGAEVEPPKPPEEKAEKPKPAPKRAKRGAKKDDSHAG